MSEAAESSRSDAMLTAYFSAEAQKIAARSSADFQSFDDWDSRRNEHRRQLREMLGLWPAPERTPLNAVITGKLERDEFTVEKVHFQSRPHLYVTGNLYLPKKAEGRAPAILYVCGHSNVKKDGVSYGSKVKYQRYGAWFARNGYVCLVIDTLQLGEIEGMHHGTYREGMWWWNARGYTPAGVETWNSIRAVDYLASRPEVDAERIGMTGRSGGGAYTWYVTALDDRVKAAVPAAGITTLENHVVDGCIARHCDCMYFVNTYRWDFTRLAALAVPRPLLILNTRQDPLFPLNGVTEIYQNVRQLYRLHGNQGDVQLTLADGPHEDSRELQMAAMRWFDTYLKGGSRDIDNVAEDSFQPEDLRVFDRLPEDQINTTIQETFVPTALSPTPPNSQADWNRQRDEWMRALREKCFGGWPAESQGDGLDRPTKLRPAFDATAGEVRFLAFDFDSQPDVKLRLYLLLPSNIGPQGLEAISMRITSPDDWTGFLAAMQIDFAKQFEGESLPAANSSAYAQLRQVIAKRRGVAFFAPRGVGPTAWSGDATQKTHIRRRFMLLGQTLDAMRIWDARRAIQTLRSLEGNDGVPLSLVAGGEMSGIALYAALFEPHLDRVQVSGLPESHRNGSDLVNVLRWLDMPQVVAMVAEHSDVQLEQVDHNAPEDAWNYPLAVAKRFGWTKRIEMRVSTSDPRAAAPEKTE